MAMTLRAFPRLVICIMLGICAAHAPSGCKSAEIRVDGTTGGIIGPRRVKVGDTFKITQAFDTRTGTDWKLGNYNRSLIEPITRQAYETKPDGSMTRVYEFRAKSPGTVELVFLHRNREPITPGVEPKPPKTKTYKVKIVK
jgi:hypothetical protein